MDGETTDLAELAHRIPNPVLIDEMHRRQINDLSLFEDDELEKELARRNNALVIITDVTIGNGPKSVPNIHAYGNVHHCVGLLDAMRARLVNDMIRMGNQNCDDGGIAT